MILKALSVRQPWAWAIVQGLKPWENRSRRFNYRGALLIHSGKTLVRGEYEAASSFIERLSGRRPPAHPELGGIVGAALLIDCAEPLRRDEGWRGAGHFGLRLERGMALPFRALSGARGLFKVEITDDEERRLQLVGLLDPVRGGRG